MKKLLSIILSLVMLLSVVPVFEITAFADVLTTGSCGKNAIYSFDSATGILTISGSGEMTGFTGSSPFKGNESITSVVIENGITTIGREVFYDCKNITNVSFPDSVNTIYAYAFYGCESLTNISIPSNVEDIYFEAFSRCGLTNLEIPNGVKTIRNEAFSSCINLLSVTISDSVISIGENPFGYCRNLANIEVNSNNTFYDSRNNCNAIIETATNKLISGCKNTEIPNDISIIGTGAFINCTSLLNLTLPNGITEIGDKAFCYCNSLAEIAILNKDCAIYDSTDTIPTSTKIYGYKDSTAEVYAQTYNRTFITLCDGENHQLSSNVIASPTWTSNGITTYTCENCGYTYDETTYLTGDCGPDITYSFDSTTGRLTITGVGYTRSYNKSYRRSPFFGIATILDVVIEEGIRGISPGLFQYCSGIRNILFPNSLERIDSLVFEGCSSLINVNIPANVYAISSDAFCRCNSITAFNVAENNLAYSVINGSLYNASKTKLVRYTPGNNETTFIFPNTVVEIGAKAFCDSEYLNTITLPSHIKIIGSSSFENCSNLSNIIILNSNCSIADTSLTIPSSSIIKACSGSTAENYALTYSRSFISIGHQYEESEYVEPTFSTSGYIKSICSVCGNEKTEPLVCYKTSEDGTRFASNNYILPVAKSFVYNDKLYARFDKSIANYSGVFSSNFKLVEIPDTSTLSCVRGILPNAPLNYYVIGGQKSGDNWIWQYSGETISTDVLQWQSGQPDNAGNNENQLSLITSNGNFNDLPLSGTAFGFIAYMDLSLAPSDAAYYGTNKYTVFRNTIPCSMARVFCEAKGGHLATIANGEENTTINNLAQADVLIGGIRNSSGNFEWVTGEPFTYTAWSTGEPNNSSNYGGQYYVNMYTNGSWDDDCDKTTAGAKSNEGFVCEYEPTSLSVQINQDNTHAVSDSEIHILTNYPDGTSNDITNIATFTKTYINGCCEVSASATKPNGEVIKCTQDITVEGEHTYVQQIVTNATCIKDGMVANICSICKSRDDEVIPATGHSYNISKRLEPTCTEPGYVQYTCTVCGDKYRENLDVLGHSFDSAPETIEATCTEDGIITYTCSRCGETQVETIESQGHQYVISETIEATCTQSGYKIYTCSVCGDICYETTDASIGHSYVSNTVSPTCTESGYIEYTCVVCDISYKSNYTNVLGHNFESYVFNNDATDLFGGTETAQCTRCDATDTRNVEKTTVYSDSISAVAGGEISVPIRIKNNSGAMGFALEFEYDSTVLTPVSVEKGSLIASGLDDNLQGDAVPGKFKVVWYGTENLTDNGILLYLNFTVSDRASGNTTIGVNYVQDDTFNESFEDVVLACEDIDISITNSSSATWYQGALTPSINEVTAGATFCVSIDGNGSSSELTNAMHTISFDNTAFTFLGYADANQHLIQTSAVSSTGEITLVTNNGHTYNARTPGEVFDALGIKYLLFKANDYANSGNYSFGYSISSTTGIEDVSVVGCDIKINASATSEVANIYIENGISGEYTDTVTVPVYISNNKGVMGYMINFEYNPDELEIVLAQRGSSFPGNFNDTIGVDEEGSFSVLWNGTDDIATDGVLMNLTFRVLTDEYVVSPITITYSQDDTFNSDYDDVVFNCISGSIHLNEEESHQFIDEVVAPTPNSKGYTKHTCSNCGYSYTDNETDYANDMSALEAALEKVSGYDSADYSAASYQQLQSVYSAYLDYPNRSIPQTTIDNATSEILTAISNLVPYLYLTVKGENGTVNVSGYEQTDKYSVLFGETITLTATADEGYVFDGWYETVAKRIRSNDETFSFKITSNTDFEARFIREQSATLTFANESGWVAGKVSKTVSEWSEVTTIEDVLPNVPYRLGYTNGRWVYDNATIIQKLQNGENVTITPEYDETDYENPVIPTPLGDEPALDLYYQLDSDNNVGSFTMATGFPENCHVESIGIAFYYKKSSAFNPTNFDLNINNKMTTSKFEVSNEDGIFTVDVKKFTSYYNWSVRGYVTYYDKDGNLKIAYSNQINIKDREQIG